MLLKTHKKDLRWQTPSHLFIFFPSPLWDVSAMKWNNILASMTTSAYQHILVFKTINDEVKFLDPGGDEVLNSIIIPFQQECWKRNIIHGKLVLCLRLCWQKNLNWEINIHSFWNQKQLLLLQSSSSVVDTCLQEHQRTNRNGW